MGHGRCDRRFILIIFLLKIEIFPPLLCAGDSRCCLREIRIFYPFMEWILVSLLEEKQTKMRKKKRGGGRKVERERGQTRGPTSTHNCKWDEFFAHQLNFHRIHLCLSHFIKNSLLFHFNFLNYLSQKELKETKNERIIWKVSSHGKVIFLASVDAESKFLHVRFPEETEKFVSFQFFQLQK